MICVNCGNRINEKEKFCTRCGASVDTDKEKSICKDCGTENELKSNFCKTCGANLNKGVQIENVEKTTRGIFDAVGGTDYTEITRYKVYYRIAEFTFKCPKCGAIKVWKTSYELYDGRCGHSQSNAEELRLLKSKIAQTLGQELWNNGSVKMVISHEL